MSAFTLALASLAFVTPTLFPDQAIHILTFDKARSLECGGLSLAFATGECVESARNAVLDLSNFGPGGVVPREAFLLQAVNKMTPDALVGVDVVIINPVDANRPMDRCEILALRDFVKQGGAVVAFAHNAMIYLRLLIDCDNTFDCARGYGIFYDNNHPILDGPFGHLSGYFETGFNCGVDDINQCGGVEILMSNIGGAAAAAFEIGSGRVFLINSFEWAMNKSGCEPLFPYWNNSPLNEELLLNALAWVSPPGDFSYEPKNCYADCDLNCELDLFDYLCFTNHFNAGSDSADCDGSGSLDLFDFLCFVNAFNAGCY